MILNAGEHIHITYEHLPSADIVVTDGTDWHFASRFVLADH